MRRSKRGLFDYIVGAGVRGLIQATPLSEAHQSAASRVLVCADPSSRIL
jgi:hypothetical protein